MSIIVNKLKQYSIVTGVTLGALLTQNSAFAAEGKTDVTINFPEIVVLHYVPELKLTFEAKGDAIAEKNASDTQLLAPTAAFDAAISPRLTAPTNVYPRDVEITVDNVWAVRGITKSGKIGVKAELGTAEATNGASVAKASSLKTTKDTVPSVGLFPSKKDIPYGGISFKLDIRNVTLAGDHTGIQYKITADAI